MPVTRQSAFTLIEMIVVIVVLMIVVGLGIWCIGLLRQDAQSVASSNILATVQRMQQLSDLNGLTQSQTDPVQRLIELQNDLAGAGYANFQFNPQTVGTQLVFSVDANGMTHWTNATP